MAQNQRIKQYKLLKKRIEGSKKEIVLYEFALKNGGKSFWAKEIIDMFGYSEAAKFGYPSVLASRLGKYIDLLPKPKRQSKRYLIIKNVLWVPMSIIEGRITRTARQYPRHGYYLVPRSDVPWWVLPEYGGKINEREMISHEKALIIIWEQEIAELHLKER
jgi:hypothetical protein